MTYLTYPMHLHVDDSPDTVSTPTTTGIRISFDCGYHTVIPRNLSVLLDVQNRLTACTCPGCGAQATALSVVERFDV